MSSILILHESGPDLDALVSFLEPSAGEIHVLSTAGPLSRSAKQLPELPEPVVILIHEDLWSDEVAPGLLDTHPTFVIGKERDLGTFAPKARFAVPYFLADVRAALRAALQSTPRRTTPPMEDKTSSAHGSILPEVSSHALLRTLCHGFNNPLGGAAGWLQILEGATPPELKTRAVRSAQAQLAKLELMLQALSMLARPLDAQQQGTDLVLAVQNARVALEREGFRLKIVVRDQSLQVCAPAEALALALRLLLHALLEGRRDDRELIVELARTPQGASVSLEESGEVLRHLAAQRGTFTELLASVRMPLALGWALLVHCAESAGGAAAITRRGGGSLMQLSLRMIEHEAESAT